MAAIMFTTAIRNSVKVGTASRYLRSNPCLAALSGSHRAVYSTLGKVQADSRPPSLSVVPLKSSFIRTASTGQDYGKLWTIERFVAASMVPLVPAAFYFGTPAMDYALAMLFALHAHWGLEAIVVDYVRPKVFGATVARLGLALVYFISAFTLGGLFYFNYSDVGIVNAIKMLWKL